MTELQTYTQVEFRRFKAFKSFSLDLKHFNVLVGPNNAGKSTILTAFRILAAAIRRAASRTPTAIRARGELHSGYQVDLSAVSVAEENIFYNYDEDEPASVIFSLANGNTMTFLCPDPGRCILLLDSPRHTIASPTDFRRHFNAPIGFVPILGPVEHNEVFYGREAARLALFNYGAARNFRNIWWHFPDKFEEFQSALRQTWPGMDIERPVLDRSHKPPRLHMFCPEKRIPRELFWAGFGFQVWCQMLTHIIQSKEVSLFLIDEPDIYLHSELQRQLIGMLRELGPDILIATHSVDIITEAEIDDIVLVNKTQRSARRIRESSQLNNVFRTLGSNINPILTQLAKTGRVVFVEGNDFQILGRFARKLSELDVANRRDFAVVPVKGFNPERIRSLKAGMELTLGARIAAAAILDRDFRCEAECDTIEAECRKFCECVVIHRRKEIENFVLVPDAIDRALTLRVQDQARRTGKQKTYVAQARELLEAYSIGRKNYVASQLITDRRHYERSIGKTEDESVGSEAALAEFECQWEDWQSRLNSLPGKEALSALNGKMQERYGVSVSELGIVDAMRVDEVSLEMVALIDILKMFSREVPAG